MFSVNHFIVSQTNPHIVPFLNLKRRMGTAGAVAESEFKHRWAGRRAEGNWGGSGSC
jgi:TAG lipase/steryl ester hydrolase/phospholipase A2/LPA acyltransferase